MMKKIVCIALALFAVAALFQIDWIGVRNEGCAFCKSEVLQAQVFYEGNSVLGLLTHKPVANGHVLIIPKRHVERFEDLTADEALELASSIKAVDAAVRDAFGNRDYLLLQKNGSKAGQTVPHVHFHYIPAVDFLTVRFFLSPWLKALSKSELKLLKETLSESLLKQSATSSSLPECSAS